MWKDKRSGKIAIVAHCILNQNSRALGLADRSSAVTEIIEFLINNDVGIIQMPCPELAYSGPVRLPQTKGQYDNLMFREHCRRIAEEVVSQIEGFFKAGIKSKIIIGVNGSPSCGVKDSGILIEELRYKLEKRKINVPFYGIRLERLVEDLIELKKLIID